MLITDFHTLQTVHTLHLAEQVILHGRNPLDTENVVRVHRTFCQRIACLQGIAVHHLNSGSVRNQIGLGGSCLVIGDNNLPLLLGVLDGRNSLDLGDNRKSLWLTSLEKLLDTGKTLGDISTGNTSGMEGSHGQLRSGLSD